MQYPQYKNKQNLETMFSADSFFNYLKSIDRYPETKAPQGIIICYHDFLFNYVLENHKTTPGDKYAKGVHFLEETNNEIAITQCRGIGAPVAAATMEEHIAWGVKSFMSIGIAGTLQKSIDIGDIVLCEKAIRDEGTSFHYLPAGKYSYASKELTEKAEIELKKLNLNYVRGSSWTIDAFYKETIKEAAAYQAEGVATVEMEASILFALAEYYKDKNIQVASMFSISDSLADLKWNPQFDSTKTRQSLEMVFEAAVNALRS